MLGGLPPLDLLILTIFILMLANGARRGFIKEASMMAGIAVGASVAGQFAPQVARMIWRESPNGLNLLMAYLGVLMAVACLVVVAVGAMTSSLVKRPELRVFNALAGAGIGAGQAFLLVGAASTFASRTGLMKPDTSKLGPVFATTLMDSLQHIPGGFGSLDKILLMTSQLPVS